MHNLYREEWSDELAEALLAAFGELQEEILLTIAKRLESLPELSDEELVKLADSAAASEYLNDDMRRIRRAIRDHDRKYAPQIAQIFDKVENETYKLAENYFKYRSLQIETLKKRSRTRELIESMQKQTVSKLLNLSHTYCCDYGGKVQPIGKTYRKIVNQAASAMVSSGQSYEKVLRKALHQLSESGIKTLEWDKETGRRVVRRAENHIRMNIAEGVRRLNQELQEENGKAFGADGVEVSLHYLCAPDHQEIQGRQFSNEEWQRINSSLKRPIGTLNCGHHVSPIILGVSKPVYSDAERADAIARSNEEVEYNGRKMTRYEASQRMRAKERRLRDMRSESKALKAAGDTSGAAAKNREIRQSVAEYKNFCKTVGLEERMDRTYYFGGVDKSKKQGKKDLSQFKLLKGNGENIAIYNNNFVGAKTITEAEKFATEHGIRHVDYSDLSLEMANLLNEAAMTLPEGIRPAYIGSGKSIQKVTGAKFSRKEKDYYGVHVDALQFRFGEYPNIEYDFEGGQCVGISTAYKTPDKIRKSKIDGNKKYAEKHEGHTQFFNTDGKSTAFHEMGHVYADKRGIPDGFEEDAKRWREESKCDMLKSKEEAWAEAWGAYHTSNPDLPDYIAKYIENATVKPVDFLVEVV